MVNEKWFEANTIRYYEFLNSIIKTRGQWALTEDFEMHHIIPKSFGGEGDTNKQIFNKNSKHINCIYLSYQEHFEAHKILAEDNLNVYELYYPYYYMSNNVEISAQEYAEIRKNFSSLQSSKISELSGDKYPQKGYHWYTDGKTNVKRLECPDGFYPGFTWTAEHKANHHKMLTESNPYARPEVKQKIHDKLHNEDGSFKYAGENSSRYGQHNSAEHRKKNSIALSKRHWCNNGVDEIFLQAGEQPPENYVFGKISKSDTVKLKYWMKVRCIETGEIFDFYKDAIAKYPKARHLLDCCAGKRNKAGGLHWEYYEETK